MARKLSRRSLAKYVATYLADGGAAKTVAPQLAAYLTESKRLKELDLILRDVQFYLAEHGHVAGRVSSARELSSETLKAIQDYAAKTTGAKKVSLDRTVDATLLGGFKLELPGRELDNTIARKLTLLKTRYKKA